MCSSKAGTFRAFSVCTRSCASWRRYEWYLASSENRNGVLCVLCVLYVRMDWVGRMCGGDGDRSNDRNRQVRRRKSSSYGWKIALASLRRSAIVVVIYSCSMRRGAGRGSRGASTGNIDDQGLVDILTTGKVRIKSATHRLLWTQQTILPLLSWADAQCEIGRIEVSPQRVGVLSQDHISYIVDQVVLINGDYCGRGTWTPDPNLAGNHVCDVGKQRLGDGRVDFVVGLGFEQVADQGCLTVGQEALSTRRAVWPLRQRRGWQDVGCERRRGAEGMAEGIVLIVNEVLGIDSLEGNGRGRADFRRWWLVRLRQR